MGGIWAFIALGPLGGFALVWVGFIGAGCFFAAGGDIKALTKTIVGMIYGAIVAWIALLIIAKVPVPGLGTVWPAIVVGVTVFFLVIVALHRYVYGYAALVGYTLSAGKLDALTAADNSNPLFLIVISSILGGVLVNAAANSATDLKALASRSTAALAVALSLQTCAAVNPTNRPKMIPRGGNMPGETDLNARARSPTASTRMTV